MNRTPIFWLEVRHNSRYTKDAFWNFLAGSFLNLLQISVLTEAEGLWLCRTNQRVAAKVTNKGGVGWRSTSTCSCVQVTLQLQIPSSRNRDAFASRTFADKAIYQDALSGAGTAMQRWITRHICQRPLDSVVLIGEIKYRRVRTSKFLMRLTRRSLPGTLVFFNRCWGPTIRTNLQPNLCWNEENRTPIPGTKTLCLNR